MASWPCGIQFPYLPQEAGLLPSLAIGHGAGMEAKEEQKEDGPWDRQAWA